MPDLVKRDERHVLIVAGEASGDLHGARLVRAIRSLDPGITVSGIGGRMMEEAGVEIMVPSSEMAVVGLTEVFSRLYFIFRASQRLKRQLRSSRPDLLILIDYPDFNINLAGTAKECGVPVLYYISPQIWAWRRGRIKKIAERVDRMAVILPFEKDFYLNSGVQVDYVGHPLLDSIPAGLDRDGIASEMGVKAGRPILGLLPGSRHEEIKNLLPLMVKASEIISSRYPDLKCVLPVAPTIPAELVRSYTEGASVDIHIAHGDIYRSLSVCDLALVASGTATLETALMGVPMVVAYKVSPITFFIAKAVVRVPHIGLVNLIAGREVVPELIQDQVTPQGLAEKALSILEDGQTGKVMTKGYGLIRERLGGGGASERTAGIALAMMGTCGMTPLQSE